MAIQNDTNTGHTLAVVGLGYVGLPVLEAFADHFSMIGYDISENVIAGIQAAYPHLAKSHVTLTTDAGELARAQTILVMVPTPIHADHTPDLAPLDSACETIGKYMQKGVTVIFESTVYPGTTEDICIPILERASGLIWKKDFWIGYSPERINPGDKNHLFTNIVKIVSGDTPETAERVKALYETVITVGTHLAPTIKVAEAAKILENVQRDINIALMNEFAMLMTEMGIENRAVLNAAYTKWNFLKFFPGLPGGHCIGVDSYYLIHKADLAGLNSKFVKMCREVNEETRLYIVQRAMSLIPAARQKQATVALFGLSFKENVDDIRHSATLEMVGDFRARGCEVFVHDPLVHNDVAEQNGITLTAKDAMPEADIIVIPTAHDEYKTWPLDYFASRLAQGGLIVDIKAMLDKAACDEKNIRIWQL